MKKKKLTNEDLTRHFKNPFDLVNHAIGVAKHLVESGHELSEVNDRNSAVVVLKKVLKEQENEERNRALADLEDKTVGEGKDLPTPLEQAI